MNPKLATLKTQLAEIEPFEATSKILLFLRMRFFNFFLTSMVQKHQNEISPIFYYGKKLKTSGTLLKIPYLQPPDWGQPYWMALYVLLILMLHWQSYILLLSIWFNDSAKRYPQKLKSLFTTKFLYVCVSSMKIFRTPDWMLNMFSM